MTPLDRSWLGRWIQPRHLHEDALDGYRQAFACDPTRSLVMTRFLPNEVARRLSDFFADECDIETQCGVYSRHGRCEEAEYEKADEANRMYKYGVFSRLRPGHELSPNAVTFLQAREALIDHRFAAVFEWISGQTLDVFDSRPHWMRHGDFLRRHTDATDARRLACVLFLSPGWAPRHGGALHLEADGHARSIEAQYNSLVVFDVRGTEHFVAPIDPSAGARVRVTLAGWIYAPPAAPPLPRDRRRNAR